MSYSSRVTQSYPAPQSNPIAYHSTKYIHLLLQSSTTHKKGLRTNFACAICSEYGHYTHHFPALPQFHQTLATVRHTSLPEPSQALPTEAHITDIHYISSSVPERMRYHPQYRDIWFMSSEPSHPVHDIPSTSSPLEDNNTYPLTVPPAISQDPLYSHIFHCDEDILEELLPLISHGMHSIIEHFSSHKRPFTLLPKPPCAQSKPRILFLRGILTGSKTLSLPPMLLKKETWPTSPPQSKLTFPLNQAS
jgi:hypothetical protein